MPINLKQVIAKESSENLAYKYYANIIIFSVIQGKNLSSDNLYGRSRVACKRPLGFLNVNIFLKFSFIYFL